MYVNPEYCTVYKEYFWKTCLEGFYWFFRLYSTVVTRKQWNYRLLCFFLHCSMLLWVFFSLSCSDYFLFKKTKTAIFPCFSQLCYCYNSSMYNVSVWYLLCWSLKVNSKWKWQQQKEMQPLSESKILRYHNWLKFVTNFLDSSPLSF